MSATDTTVTDELLNQWATDPNGPVALHLKQKLLPVEGKGGVIFPPTYADIGYNIDTLSDGTKVATIDSVGSQANRMEPLFKSTSKDDNGEELNPLAALVPQVQIILNPVPDDKKKLAKGLASLEEDDEKKKEKVKELEKKEVEELRKLWIESPLFDERRQSLLDLAHRSADAVVKATPELRKLIDPAFVALSRHGNAGPLCAVAPTSLLFGVWDSRDGTGEKRPRLVRSVIRAWDVDVLHSAAQFNSVWKALSEEDQDALKEEEKKKSKVKRSVAGLADAPSSFRPDSKATKFLNGVANPEARVLGGVLANGSIERTVTINLVALRGLHGGTDKETKQIRKYLLTLALLAATTELDLFLREGCFLRYADAKDKWVQVPRRGEPAPIEVPARDALIVMATDAAKPFKEKWPRAKNGESALQYKFDVKKAKALLAKKAEDEADAS